MRTQITIHLHLTVCARSGKVDESIWDRVVRVKLISAVLHDCECMCVKPHLQHCLNAYAHPSLVLLFFLISLEGKVSVVHTRTFQHLN